MAKKRTKKHIKQTVLKADTQPTEEATSIDGVRPSDEVREVSGQVERNLGGRPTKYKPEYCDILIKVFKEGGYISEACEAMGVSSLKTFHNWVNTIPEFKDAYEEAQIASQAWHERVGKAAMLGQLKGFNYPVWARIMGAKFKKEYGDAATEIGKKTQINIGSINSIENMPASDLDAKIKKLTEKLDLVPKSDSNNE